MHKIASLETIEAGSGLALYPPAWFARPVGAVPASGLVLPLGLSIAGKRIGSAAEASA